MNRNENLKDNESDSCHRESGQKIDKGNHAVKLAMARELLEMGIHPRSVERLLNIRLDPQPANKESIRNKEDNHGC